MGYSAKHSERRPQTPVRTEKKSVPVDVVVTCHNYGRFLKACLDSIMNQTAMPASIRVILDRCTDNSQAIADQFEGIVSVSVDYGDPVKSRAEGIKRGLAEFILLVDADNTLPDKFIQTAVEAVSSENVVCVYPDLRKFGGATGVLKTPTHFNKGWLYRSNYIDTCSLLRRSALDLLDVDAFTADVFGETPEDYIVAQSLERIGGQFRRNPTPLNYRVHEQSRTCTKHRDASRSRRWSKSAGVDWQPVTVFIPLSGRAWAWDHQKEFLNRQTFNHDNLNIVLCDTSQNKTFNNSLRRWAATCDYNDVRVFKMSVATPGLADETRGGRPDIEKFVNLALCRIYNRMRRELSTAFCITLEDDVIPPDDAFTMMFEAMTPDTASVFAPYPSRFVDNHVCWSSGCPGLRGDRTPVIHCKPNEARPIQDIRGNGFGCTLFRSEVLEKHLFQVPQGHRYYDPFFYHVLGDQWRRRVHWGCLSQHLSAQSAK